MVETFLLYVRYDDTTGVVFISHLPILQLKASGEPQILNAASNDVISSRSKISIAGAPAINLPAYGVSTGGVLTYIVNGDEEFSFPAFETWIRANY